MTITQQIFAITRAMLASERFYMLWVHHKKISARTWAVVIHDRTLISFDKKQNTVYNLRNDETQ